MPPIYPAFFQNVVFPALDLVNRTQVWQTYCFLNESQWWSADRLAELQTTKLGKHLAWTRAHSAFYRAHWESAGDDRRASSRWPELDGLPIVRKADLRAANDLEFPLPAFSGRALAVKTSGSTGHPMTFYRSLEQESWFWALRMRMWAWGGYVPGEPYLTLNLNARTAWKKRLQDEIFRCRYHGFNANQNDVDAVIRDLRKDRTPHLVGYASSLNLLAHELERRGEKIDFVRSILATGDSLQPSYRERIERVFGTGVNDYYGAGGEGLHLASQCEERSLYHLHPENACVEILVDGRPARAGEMGEIVVTQFDNRAMPLIRYATADAAIESDAKDCPCGRAFPLIEGVVGRVADVVRAPDGSVLVVHFFTILFEHLDGIRQFQVVQSKHDRLRVRLVVGSDFKRQSVERHVRVEIGRATDGSLAVDFEYPDEIPLAASMKRRLVVSELEDAPTPRSAS